MVYKKLDYFISSNIPVIHSMMLACKMKLNRFTLFLIDCLKFVENALNKWDIKKNKNVNMDDQLVKLRALTNSVEYNLCSYSFGSQTFLIQNAKSIIQNTQYSLHQIVLSAVKHFQQLNEFKQSFGHSIKDDLSELQTKISQKLDAMKKIDYDDNSLKKQIDEAIHVFQKLSIMYDLRY